MARRTRRRQTAAGGAPRALLAVVLGGAAGGLAAADGPWLRDVAAERGLLFVHDPAVGGAYAVPESIGAGAALFDYDGDGDLDAYLVDGARTGSAAGGGEPLSNRLFRQDADGSFTDVTARSGLGDAGYGMGVAVGDVDGDGDPDVYVTNAGPDALYRNDGDGSFTEVTAAAGIDNPAWGSSAVFFDSDGDGDLDLYVANYLAPDPAAVCTDAAGRRDYCGPDGFPGVPDVLYRNDGRGRFTDVSAPAGIGAVARKGLGVAAADLDGDRRPDLYVANDGEANLLWINRGDGTFADAALERGAAFDEMGRAEAGMGVALGDADGDGAADLFVTHLRAETNTLYRSAGAAGFVDATTAAGLGGPSRPYTGFGTGFVDLDNDGDLDLAVVNGRVTRGPLLTAGPASYWDPYAEPGQLFANDGRGRFSEAGARAGDFATPANGRGLALGDVDGDGGVDLLVTRGGGPAALFLNQVPGRGHWLRLDPPDSAPASAVGAAVTALAGGRRLHRVLGAGSGYLSSSDPRLHLGLGAAEVVDELRVRWPGGRELVLRRVAAGRALVLPAPRE